MESEIVLSAFYTEVAWAHACFQLDLALRIAYANDS